MRLARSQYRPPVGSGPPPIRREEKMRFSVNTTVHPPNADSESFEAGDEIPEHLLEFVGKHVIAGPEVEAKEETDNYQRMNVRSLIAEAQDRGIAVESNRKPDLIAALRADDADVIR